ncbi:hypothetical protein AMJ47_02990 [Parcubacteria bacterium DG_72]|nr:MAG: hypothetical protein AMJ47_02990 [Parcubacteria bacterium DG_72]
MKYFILIIIILVLSAGLLILWGVYSPAGSSEELVVFLVKKGEGLNQIAENLQEQDLIKNKYFFIAYTLFKKQEKDLIAGEYELSYSMNVPKILQKISSGDRIKRIITIIEGWTVKDIEQKLNMGEIDPSLEGYLFPDTYEIHPDDELADIIKKMQDNFNKKITEEIRQKITAQQKALEQVIIMASILEREVQTLEDKKVVSGILWKRMDNNMFLQADATVTYITGGKSTELTKEELAIDSPYNTYKYKGLPPGPISNPGLNSILAAIHPVKTKYWFYLSTSEAETIFSTTLAEHEAARQKYLK